MGDGLCVPDVVPYTVEQQEEYRMAEARQQFRRQRHESTTGANENSGNFDPDSPQARELAVHCISYVLRMKESTDVRWKKLPAVEGIDLLVELGPPGTGSR